MASILTGKPGEPRPRTQRPQEATAEAAGQIMREQCDRLAAELQVARAEITAARSETAAERAKVDSLREQLRSEAEARVQAQAELAAERRAREGVDALIEREREARVALQTSLDRAVAAKPQPITFPTNEPVSYEMEVSGRDVNERVRKVRITPVVRG